MEFSPEQKYVIENFTDNVILVARAGSGKTFTVAHRVAEALKRGYSPEEILCITFTVKAAEEMKQAVEKHAGRRGGAQVFTIHGFCYDLVKKYARKSGAMREPEVADEIDCGELLSFLLSEYADEGLYEKSDGGAMLGEKQLAAIISLIKHERERLGYGYFREGGYGEAIEALKGTREYERLFTAKKSGVKVTDYSFKDLLAEKGEEFFARYKRLLSSSCLMDFDDLLLCAKSVTETPFDNPYKMVIIDEMQDTTSLEYSVLRRFFKGALVLLCGDPYQTIYGWRGSAPEKVIEDFVENFNAKTVALGNNRRSSPFLSYAGAYYLASSFKGFPFPEKTEFCDSDGIEVYPCASAREEAEKVFGIIRNLGSGADVCVMARSNRYIADFYAESEKINAELPKEDRIKFFTADGDHQFFKKPIIKDFLALLRLAVNPWDFASFERIAKKYAGATRGALSAIKDYGKFGIGPSSFLTSDAAEYGDGYFLLIKAYRENGIVVYDAETTGLDTERDEIIQLSAVKTGKDGEIARFSEFIVPDVPVSEEAERTHGYGIDYLRSHGGKRAEEVLSAFSAFCGDCVLVGHNSGNFDDAILSREAKKYGVNFDIKAFYDTLRIAGVFSPELPDRKLSTLCEKFGVVNERAHDALSDVIATEKCLIKYIEKYVIPTENDRRRILSLYSDKYAGLLSAREKILYFAEKRDALGLVRYADETLGLVSRSKKRSDRDSANDFYVALKEIETAEDPKAFLSSFVSLAALSGSQMDLAFRKLGKTPLITVHQSKGCEFDTVILIGASEDEFPSYGARISGEEDEEKRVFYVALSRAKNRFIMTYKAERKVGSYVFPVKKSPYIENLPFAKKNI